MSSPIRAMKRARAKQDGAFVGARRKHGKHANHHGGPRLLSAREIAMEKAAQFGRLARDAYRAGGPTES